MSADIIGSHFVGSLNTSSARESFELASRLAGHSFSRIPDGEFGERWYWLQFQTLRLDRVKGLSRVGDDPILLRDQFDQRPFRFDGSVPVEQIEITDIGYADAALSSYAEFVVAKEEGLLAPTVRFQVSLPTSYAVATAFVVPEDRVAFDRIYTRALLADIERILAGVPAGELALQFDIAVEFLFIEQVEAWTGSAPYWFSGAASTGAGTVENAEQALSEVFDDLAVPVAGWIDRIPEPVEVGIHLCYGDIEESHFAQPRDAANLVRFANTVADRVERTLTWVHLPVPIERSDREYFAPLADLRLSGDTELYLGLLHREDTPAARIAAAGEFVPAFGLSTECGFGRSPKESIEGIFAQHDTTVYA